MSCKVTAIVLAAGASRRMGRQKLLLQILNIVISQLFYHHFHSFLYKISRKLEVGHSRKYQRIDLLFFSDILGIDINSIISTIKELIPLKILSLPQILVNKLTYG